MKFIFTLICLLASISAGGQTITFNWDEARYTAKRYGNECTLIEANATSELYVPTQACYKYKYGSANQYNGFHWYNVTKIAELAFLKNTAIKNIRIPSNVKSIGNECFEGCRNLRSIVITPNENLVLGKNLFFQCSNLDSLVINSVYPPQNADSAFINTKDIFTRTTLYVPKGCIQLYKNDKTFSKFKNIVGIKGYADSYLYHDGFIFTLGQNNAILVDTEHKIQNTIIVPDSIVYEDKIYFVTSIRDNALKNIDSLKTIVIPSSVSTVGLLYGDGNSGKGKTIYNFSSQFIEPFGATEYMLPFLEGKPNNYISETRYLFNHIAQIKGAILSDCRDNVSIISAYTTTNTKKTFEATSPKEKTIMIKGLSPGGNQPNNVVNLKIRINDVGDFTIKNYRIPTRQFINKPLYHKITQSSVTYLVTTNEDETATIDKITTTLGGEKLQMKRVAPYVFEISFNGLLSNRSYSPRFFVEEHKVGNTYEYYHLTDFVFKTLSVMPKIAVQNSPSVVRALGTYTSGDASILKTELGFAGKFVSGNNYISDILAPNTTYNMEYRVYTGENYYENTSLQITTPALELTTTKEAKSVSNTTAIISATTNLDEMDTRAGFEWRRYDAPDLVPSSRANCPIIDGVMMGALKNLNTNTYYKFRPYYVDINGKEYFGDWSAFGTADAYVYFDPTVRTYSVSSIEDNRAVVRGCAVAGSDAIEEQGFEYWPVDSENVPSMRQLMAMANKQTVKADGQWMTATLSNLNSGQTYAVRAYVKTAKETTYGNTETFTTTNITGINKVFKSSQGLDVKIVGQSRSHVTLNVEGMQGRGRYLLYNLNGAMICNGEIEANAFSQDINTSQLSSGIYLLRVADNKQCKTIRIIIK